MFELCSKSVDVLITAFGKLGKNIGLGADKIELVKSNGPAETEWPKILAAARDKLG